MSTMGWWNVLRPRWRLPSHWCAILLLLGAAGLAPSLADAQQSEKIPRIALVHPDVPLNELLGPEPIAERPRVFLQRLRDLDYVEGENIIIERRSAEGDVERLPGIMAELAGLPVDLIVALGDVTVRAALQATQTISVVGIVFWNPVESGLAASLGRPGGNFTGFATVVDFRIDGKLLQLLTEAAPGVKRVAVLTGSEPQSSLAPTPPITPELAEAARKLGVELLHFPAGESEQLANAFAAIGRAKPDALLMFMGTYSVRDRIAEFALQNHLPSIAEHLAYVDEGVMMAYAADFNDLARGGADYVDKILKGAKPGDLPIQQPTRFYLAVNQKTLAALGITLPPSLMIRVDRVIE